jgi:hypothetical protein
MNQIIGLCSHSKRCRYCGREFFYVSGGSVRDPIGEYRKAYEERDAHERVCTERFLHGAKKNDEWSDIYDRDVENYIKDVKRLISERKRRSEK